MKKAHLKTKLLNRINLVFILCFLIFNSTGCGLDTYIVMPEPVISITKAPDYQNIDKVENYFEFVTNEKDAGFPLDFKFLGTDVYYKIYSNANTMKTEINMLVSLASSSTTKAKSAEKLINPSSSSGYGYKSLKSTNYNNSPLVLASSTNENQRVYIRLTDYQNSEEYSAKILVNGAYIKNSALKTVPIRNSSDDLTFNFGRTGPKDKVPLATGEDDVKYTTETEAGMWYVAMFAVGVGRDTTYTTYYSNIEYLGSVTIDVNSEDN